MARKRNSSNRERSIGLHSQRNSTTREACWSFLRRILTIATLLLVTGLASSKSSKLLMSWKNPNYVPGKELHRVLALGLSDKTAIRADFEDALAEQLRGTGVETIAGNTVLLRPESTRLDPDYLRAQIRANNIDAVVVSRLIKVEKNVTYIPGGTYVVPYPYYNTFYGYYGAVYSVVSSPDYLREEKKVRIETRLYETSSLEGELVWTGITDTFNPTNVHKSINGLVRLVVKQMRDEGVLEQ